jgi:hypothetical protein
MTAEPKKRSEHELDKYEPGNASTERALSKNRCAEIRLNCESKSLIRAPAYDPKADLAKAQTPC